MFLKFAGGFYIGFLQFALYLNSFSKNTGYFWKWILQHTKSQIVLFEYIASRIDSQSDREFTFSYALHAILLNIRALEPARSYYLNALLHVSIADQTVSLRLAMRFMRFFWTFARLSPRLVLRLNNLESLWGELVGGSRGRFLYRDLISQQKCHAIPQQWFERPETSKSTSSA